MRTIATVLLIVACGISSASAQGATWSMDHGHAADAVAAKRAAADAAAAKAKAIAAGTPLTPSQSTDFSVNGGTVIRAAPPRTAEEQKADEDGRATWEARCRPTVVEDRDGMRRTQYAAPDCDLSRFNTAGAK